ncbi:MAG: hypothetical protein N2C14_11020, partial [Planctomycetales bacterium]
LDESKKKSKGEGQDEDSQEAMVAAAVENSSQSMETQSLRAPEEQTPRSLEASEEFDAPEESDDSQPLIQTDQPSVAATAAASAASAKLNPAELIGELAYAVAVGAGAAAAVGYPLGDGLPMALGSGVGVGAVFGIGRIIFLVAAQKK